MVIEINKDNPQKRLITKVVSILKEGGIIIYPTDTVYAYGCDINNKKAIEKIYWLKKVPKHKPLTFIFADFSEISHYARNISKQAFKIMKKVLPGPFTFIFKATKLVPKIAISNQKTIGIRMPDNNIALDIVHELGRPIMSASVSNLEGEYIMNINDLDLVLQNEVDLIIDFGPMVPDPSTIIDFTGNEPLLVREGKGQLNF